MLLEDNQVSRREVILRNLFFLVPYFFVVILSAFAMYNYSKTDIHAYLNQFYHEAFDFFFKYFTHLGDGIFGLNIGATQTNRPKLRGDLNSADYRTYMESLYDANPAMYEQVFPFSSGASIRNLSRFAPGIGTLQRLFDAGRGKVSDFFMDKGIIKDTRNDPPVGIANTNAGSAANRALNAFRYGSFNTNQQPFMTNIPTGEEIYSGANILEGAPTNIQQIKTNKKEPQMMYANLNPYALTPEQIINR